MDIFKDCNGVEIQAGDIVEVTGDYVKDNNCLYVVDGKPGEPGWADNCLTLVRVSKTGKVAAKNREGFWPIVHSGNKDEKKRQRAMAAGWKGDDVKIRISSVNKVDDVVGFFKQTANDLRSMGEREINWGFIEIGEGRKTRADYLERVAARIMASA